MYTAKHRNLVGRYGKYEKEVFECVTCRCDGVVFGSMRPKKNLEPSKSALMEHILHTVS